MDNIVLEEEVAKEDEEGIILELAGATEMDMMLQHVRSHKILLDKKGIKRKENHQIKGKEKHPIPLIGLWHIATLE